MSNSSDGNFIRFQVVKCISFLEAKQLYHLTIEWAINVQMTVARKSTEG